MRRKDHSPGGCHRDRAAAPATPRPLTGGAVLATFVCGLAVVLLSIGASGSADASAGGRRVSTPRSRFTARASNNDLQKLRQFARCMREHGIDFPHLGTAEHSSRPGSEPHSSTGSSGPDRSSPRYKAARHDCQRFLAGVSE